MDSGAIYVKNGETGHTPDLLWQCSNQARVVRHVELSQRDQIGHGVRQSSLSSATMGGYSSYSKTIVVAC